MSDEEQAANSAETRRWMLVATVAGLGAGLSYYLPVQLGGTLPMRASYLVFFMFGPLFCVAVLALYHFLRVELDSVLLPIGTMLMVAGGAVNTLMGAMQGALRMTFDGLPHGEAVAESTHTAWRMALVSGDALQLGADMAWDVFVLSGLVLFGLAVSRHPRFGRRFGWPAVLIGVCGLGLNGWSFPTPPGSAGLFDIGPVVGLWFTAVTIYLLVLMRRMPRPGVS